MDKDPNKDEKPDHIPHYLITLIYALFTAYIATFYVADRKMVVMLVPVFYLFWYMLLFFTE